MVVGVPREVKPDEYRVGLLPVGIELLVKAGHTVLVQQGAGDGAGCCDEVYTAVGAEIVPTASDVWERADLVVKVKEPQPIEIPMMRRGQQVFTYFHFAADRSLTLGCLEQGITAIVYETLEAPAPGGRTTLPLLTPMSEVAGRLSIQAGAKHLERPQGGSGVLLGGVPGVAPGRVLVIGGGVVGTHAAQMAAGLGADVTLMDIDLERLRELAEFMPANVKTMYSEPHAVREELQHADLVIGAVLVPAAKAPQLIPREALSLMQPRSVIVDVAIDQGGCVETAKATTHADPVYTVDGVVHYCVANMPGAVPRCSTRALTNATLPWVLKIAEKGAHKLAEENRWFRRALGMDNGELYSAPVAEAHGLDLVTV